MQNYAFVLLLALNLVVGVKIDQWTTNRYIGLSLEVPQGFLARPRAYDVARNVLVLGAAITLFFVTFPWYYGLAALAVAWFSTTWIGQSLSFSNYRAIWRDLAEHAETEEDEMQATQNSRRTNTELRDMALTMAKFAP